VTRFFAEYDGNEEILQAHNYSAEVASNIYMNVIFSRLLRCRSVMKSGVVLFLIQNMRNKAFSTN